MAVSAFGALSTQHSEQVAFVVIAILLILFFVNRLIAESEDRFDDF